MMPATRCGACRRRARSLHAINCSTHESISSGLDAFRGYMGDRFAPALAQNGFVLKPRLHLLEPYEQPPEDSPKVANLSQEELDGGNGREHAVAP